MTFTCPRLEGSWISSSFLAHCWQWLKAALRWLFSGLHEMSWWAPKSPCCCLSWLPDLFSSLVLHWLSFAGICVTRETKEGNSRYGYENVNALMREACQISIKAKVAERSVQGSGWWYNFRSPPGCFRLPSGAWGEKSHLHLSLQGHECLRQPWCQGEKNIKLCAGRGSRKYLEAFWEGKIWSFPYTVSNVLDTTLVLQPMVRPGEIWKAWVMPLAQEWFATQKWGNELAQHFPALLPPCAAHRLGVLLSTWSCFTCVWGTSTQLVYIYVVVTQCFTFCLCCSL